MFGRIAIVRGDKFVIATGVHCLGCRREPSGGTVRKDLHVSFDFTTSQVQTLNGQTIGKIFEKGTVDTIAAWLLTGE